MIKLFRGVSDKQFAEIKKGSIPAGSNFTTDYFMARKHGKNVLQVKHSKTNFIRGNDSVFKTLTIKEQYYQNKKPIKQYKKVLDLIKK